MSERYRLGWTDYRAVFGRSEPPVEPRMERRADIWRRILDDHCPAIMRNLGTIFRLSLPWFSDTQGSRRRRAPRQIPRPSNQAGKPDALRP